MNEKEKKLLVQSREEGRSIESKPQRGLTVVGGAHGKEGSRAITEAIEKFSERTDARLPRDVQSFHQGETESLFTPTERPVER